MKKLTVAICTYNGAKRVPALVLALNEETCSIPFEILIVDNNSNDDTEGAVKSLGDRISADLRFVKEQQQGIAFARNRAIEESIQNDFLLFIDDDELPSKGMLNAAITSLQFEGAECVGGRIFADLGNRTPPLWLTKDLLAFYGEIDYGNEPFWIKDRTTPVWSGLVAYRTELFINNPNLRFDHRYNRKGTAIGGGEDSILFRELLERKVRIRYQPNMKVDHLIPAWKIRRRYFIKLHFVAGKKYGQYEIQPAENAFFGVPPFLIRQFLLQFVRSTIALLGRKHGYVRQIMNASHSLGAILGMYITRKNK